MQLDDIVVAVANEQDDWIYMEGLDWPAANEMIYGKEGTTVKLKIRKPDGSSRIVKQIRSAVDSEAIRLKSLITGKHGYIKVPAFYTDSTVGGGSGCITDMQQSLTKFKKEKVKGLILDLRDNSGGSLHEMLGMMNLFVPDKVSVQVRDKDNVTIVSGAVANAGSIYNGPVVILVNEFTASVAELFAATMQDNKRAVIVGTPTFGKGVLQQSYRVRIKHMEFRKVTDSSYGTIELTAQQFYRSNGLPLQESPIIPDIQLPVVSRRVGQPLSFISERIAPWVNTSGSSFVDYSSIIPAIQSGIQKNEQLVALKENYTARYELNHTPVPLNMADYSMRLKQLDKLEKEAGELLKVPAKQQISWKPLTKNKLPIADPWIPALSGDWQFHYAALTLREMINSLKK